MYAYIRGTLVQIATTYAIVDVQGIGYKIQVPYNTYIQLQSGKEILLYTSFVVREFDHSLYGFLQQEEKDLFETLLEISGIGPKTALNIIGHLPLSALYEAVIQENLQSFIKVPGIGKKTAERLLIELRDKISHPKEFAIKMPSNAKQQVIQDAIKALIHLGYNSSQAQKAIKKSLEQNETQDLSALISAALKHV